MTYLQSYNEKEMLGYFTDGRTVYELHVLEISFLGLMKKNKIIDYTIEYNMNNKLFKDNWDKIILDKNPLKNNGMSIADWIGLTFIIILITPFILLTKIIND